MPIINGNCLEVMPTLKAGSIDCIVTDPAYWTLNKWREVGTTTRLGGHRDEDKRSGWFQTIDRDELYSCLCEFYRLLPKNGHAWVMADNEVQSIIQGFVREGETGFDYVKSFPVIKMRTDGLAVKQGMGYHGRCTHEYVVLCEKGRRRFTDENWPDIFQVAWIGDTETRHLTVDGKGFPTAKPLSLFKRLVELSSAEGENILDPFAGSGTAIIAALSLNRAYTGIEISADNAALIEKRITLYRDSEISLFANTPSRLADQKAGSNG